VSQKFVIPDSERGWFRFILEAIQRGIDTPIKMDEVPEHNESPIGAMISRLTNAKLKEKQ